MLKLKYELFDFEQWAALAESDPKGFEQLRCLYIEKFIKRMPENNQARMQRLQWRIDMERQRSENPMGACVRISRMMWDAVLGENGLLPTISELDKAFHVTDTAKLPKAKVLPFTPKQSH